MLPKLLKLAQKLDRANAHSPTSLTNRLYQELYPRETGVVVYGALRMIPGTPIYEAAKRVGEAIGNISTPDGKRFHVVTGGGPGAMRAVAEGAIAAGSHAAGAAMEFIGEAPSHEAHPEFVVHENFSDRFDARGGYDHRAAFTVAVPGGVGTEQELWKKANELMTDKTLYPCQKQIVLYDFENYYTAPRGFMDHIDYMIEKGLASPRSREIFKIAKTPEDVAMILQDPNVPWTTGLLPNGGKDGGPVRS